LKINKLLIKIPTILFSAGGEVRREGNDSSDERGSINNAYFFKNHFYHSNFVFFFV
jgi:hypothetical protein